MKWLLSAVIDLGVELVQMCFPPLRLIPFACRRYNTYTVHHTHTHTHIRIHIHIHFVCLIGTELIMTLLLKDESLGTFWYVYTGILESEMNRLFLNEMKAPNAISTPTYTIHFQTICLQYHYSVLQSGGCIQLQDNRILLSLIREICLLVHHSHKTFNKYYNKTFNI